MSNNNPLTVDEDFKTWLKGCLRSEQEDVLVTFTKKDGTERVLKCTLAESRIPSDHAPKAKGDTKTSDAALAVYDVESAGWRSFRWDSIKQVEVQPA